MGRPRKPTALHELNGTWDKHPERRRARQHEPKPTGPLGGPPAAFLDQFSETSRSLLAIWNELIHMAPPGVLTSADRFHVELTCRLMHRVRTEQATAGEYSRLDSLLGKMGMNPADRSKVSVAPTAASQASSNPFEEIANEEKSEQEVRSRPN
jgi:hypothetical protein